MSYKKYCTSLNVYKIILITFDILELYHFRIYGYIKNILQYNMRSAMNATSGHPST